jgi:catechol 2,3-dioxygenase-like lactoylglutathione lyase family enzyme
VTLGLPGMRGVDHIGVTVPDLDQAERFFVDILGGERIYVLGEKRDDEGDWMRDQLGVHPRSVIREIRFFRIGDGSNLEAYVYDAADGQAAPARNSDLGSQHLALYVEDLDAAAEFLRERGIEVMGAPVSSAGAAEGQRWLYFRSPWGMQFELVSYPDGKAYERDTTRMLWHPAHPAR